MQQLGSLLQKSGLALYLPKQRWQKLIFFRSLTCDKYFVHIFINAKQQKTQLHMNKWTMVNINASNALANIQSAQSWITPVAGHF